VLKLFHTYPRQVGHQIFCKGGVAVPHFCAFPPIILGTLSPFLVLICVPMVDLTISTPLKKSQLRSTAPLLPSLSSLLPPFLRVSFPP